MLKLDHNITDNFGAIVRKRNYLGVSENILGVGNELRPGLELQLLKAAES